MSNLGHIFVHGIYQRSGTNHVLHLISKHPQVKVFPQGIWEFPWLALADDLVAFDGRFTGHSKVTEIEPGTLLRVFGDAVLNFLLAEPSSNRRLALKYPTVENLQRFFEFFPSHCLLIVVRDGRDVASSAMQTSFARPKSAHLTHFGTWRYWLKNPYVVLAENWKCASQTIRRFLAQIEGTPHARQVQVVRYEDLVNNRASMVQKILSRLDLDLASFPWSDLDDEPIRGSSFAGERSKGQLDWRPTVVERGEFLPVGRWHDWGPDVLVKYMREAGDELAVWGYADTIRSPHEELQAWLLSPVE